jgi:hypothetical protein
MVYFTGLHMFSKLNKILHIELALMLNTVDKKQLSMLPTEWQMKILHSSCY